MQLVLVDKRDVHFTTRNNQRPSLTLYQRANYSYSFIGELSICPIQSQCEEDEIVNSLISEITARNKTATPSTLQIDLTPTGSNYDYEFRLSVRDVSNFKILKELRDRYQDEVKIEVSVKVTTDEDEAYQYNIEPGSDILSQTGMTINAESFDCVHGSAHVIDVHALRHAAMDIQVIAHIPKDIPMKVTEVTVADKTKGIFEESLFSDVIITAGNGAEIKCNKCFLVVSSSVFRNMFGTEMVEAHTGKVDMTDLSEEGVTAFLRYLYFNERIAPNGNIEVAYEVLYAAHKYDVPGLEALMITYLLQRKNGDFGTNLAFKTFMFVRNIECASALKAKMVHILQLKFDELKTLSEFKELFQKNPGDAIELCEQFAKTPSRI